MFDLQAPSGALRQYAFKQFGIGWLRGHHQFLGQFIIQIILADKRFENLRFLLRAIGQFRVERLVTLIDAMTKIKYLDTALPCLAGTGYDVDVELAVAAHILLFKDMVQAFYLVLLVIRGLLLL